MPLGFGLGLRLGQPLSRAYPSWVPYGATFGLDGLGRRGWRKEIGGVGERFDEANLGDLVSITRVGGTATQFTSSGLLESVAADTLRFDHDMSGTPLGILIEGARTNVVLWNRDLTNAAWTKTNVTAAKTQTGVDGATNSASSIAATAGNGTCLQAITLASSARAQSAYVKRLVGTGAVEMTMDGGSTWTAVTVTAAWTRVTIPTQTLANPGAGFRLATSGDSIAIDYVQNENGTFPSSAIATTTASVARGADVLTAAAGEWFNASEGALVAEWSLPSAGHGQNRNLLAIHGATANNGLSVIGESSGNTIIAAAAVSGTTPVAIGLGATVAAQMEMVSFAYKADDYAASRNGAAAGADTSGAVPADLTTVVFGNSQTSGSPLFGNIRSVFYIDRRVTNAELQALSA